MRILSLMLLVFVNACFHPCDRIDMFVDGLCVVTNDYDVDAEQISQVIAIVNANVGRRLKHTEDYDLSARLEQTGAGVEYVGDIFAGYKTGDFAPWNNHIRIKHPSLHNSPGTEEHCGYLGYVLSHELLHFVEKDILGGATLDHSTEYMWMEWGAERDYHYTVDNLNSLDVIRMCSEAFAD